MINWQFFPKSLTIPNHLNDIREIFDKNLSKIDSEKFTLDSNDVLAILRQDLEELGFQVEKSRSRSDKIQIPVLYGLNGTLEKSFYADGYNKITHTVIEVEAGRAVDNHQFLKDLFQACMMHDVDYLIIAVRNVYRGKKDFLRVIVFFETLYASGRLQLPLKGILIIGY